LKGRFFGKQRDDNAAEEPDGVALESLLEAVAEGFKRAGLFHERIELTERNHASALDPFGAAFNVS